MFVRTIKSDKRLSKIKVRATVLNYSGSIEIPKHLLAKCGMRPGEMITVHNRTNGAIFETYIIETAKRFSGVRLFGPAARLGQAGDVLDLTVYAMK